MNRRARVAALAAVPLLVLFLAWSLQTGGEAIRLPARNPLGELWRRLEPPSIDFYRALAPAVLETISVSIAGTTLAVFLGVPLALVGTGTLWLAEPLRRHESASWLARTLARAVYLAGRSAMSLLRAIPEILWALLLVRVVGLGPAAGALAIGVTYGAMLGKVYSELLEGAPKGPLESLASTGASIPVVFLYGMLPLVRGPIVGYTLYRWECAIRASALMGLVGAGGLGFQILLSFRYQRWGELAVLVAVLVALVSATDLASSLLRRKWFHARAVARE